MNRKEAEFPDFEINARVRQVLARRWVVQHELEIGTTDGVVVLKGRLAREPGGPAAADCPEARETFLRRLRSELKGIPGVVDVVMELHDAERTDAA